MKKKVFIGIVIGAVVLGVAAWLLVDFKQNTASPSQSPPASNENSAPSVDAAATITYTNDGFSPKEVTVKSGDTIEIVNKASSALEFSSDDHPTHLEDPELNLATLDPGQKTSLKVNEKGTWGYHNHLKAADMGTITVK